MQDDLPQPSVSAATVRKWNPGRVTAALLMGVVAACILSCLLIAAEKSTGLTSVAVTATENAVEPRDLALPGMGDSELPDYHIQLVLADGGTRELGTIPNTLAKDKLTWQLPEPLGVTRISRVRLLEEDPALSDVIAEVSVADQPLVEKGYRFEFQTVRSFAVGLESFFETAIGKAIVVGLFLAIVLAVAAFLGLN